MAKSVYYGTTLDEARRIVEGDHSMFIDGMLPQQTFLGIHAAVGAAERSRRTEADRPAVVQLLVRDRSYRAGNRIKIKSARIVSDEELLRLTGYSFDRNEIGDLPAGIVLRISHRIYMVECEGTVYRCSLRRRLTPMLRAGKSRPVTIGDRVSVRIVDQENGVIEGVMERDTEYGRMRSASSPGHRHADALANVDGLIIVSAVKFPPVWVTLVDRYCVIAEAAGIRPLICVNKIDLLDDRTPLLDLLAVYEKVGYDTLVTSVETGEGVEELRAWMRGRTSSLVGLSGVGKSSLLNAIQTGLCLKTQPVNERRGGRHTTSAAELYPLDGGGYVADTPGIRGLAFLDIIPQMVHQYFPEMRRIGQGCATSPCYHLREADCAVKAAVEAGEIAPSRYESYGKCCSI